MDSREGRVQNRLNLQRSPKNRRATHEHATRAAGGRGPHEPPGEGAGGPHEPWGLHEPRGLCGEVDARWSRSGGKQRGGIPGGGMFHVKHLFHALAKEAPPVKPTDACRAETAAATRAAAPRVRGGKPRGPRIGGEPWGRRMGTWAARGPQAAGSASHGSRTSRGGSMRDPRWGGRGRRGRRPARTSAEACGGGASRKRESPRGDPQAMKGASAEGASYRGAGEASRRGS